ncbi:MAG: M61 family metallopeptidase [FCB group bacterium]|nr:M61 family metallopeptidase [FCB group bacterium]
MGKNEIHYTVIIAEPHKHIVTIEMAVDADGAQYADFALPAWTPGSYKIRDFARHIISLTATAGVHALAVHKIDKHTWRVSTGGRSRIILTYQVYAFELTVRTSYLDADHAMLNGASLFLYQVGHQDRPHTVTINKPETWSTISTGLKEILQDKNTFYAETYDLLIDTPIAVGNQQLHKFIVSGVPHEFVIFGSGNFDIHKIIEDTTKILTAAHLMFGSVPYDRYIFFLHLLPDGFGGLEHHNSCHMMFGQFKFRERKDYIRFLGLVSHEFFHTYNVKRIRPQGLGPFNYNEEFYSKLHWITEGITSYYDNQMLLRAEVISIDEYLDLIAEDIRKYQNTPGRLVQTTEESSFDQWIKLYQPDENTQNIVISYYLSGSLIAMALDLEIRRLTRGEKSLDDVYRKLWKEYLKTGLGFTEKHFKTLCERTAGDKLTHIWHYLSSTEELDFEKLLKPFGLRLEKTYKKENAQPGAWFGMELDEKLNITRLYAGAPAWEGGLNKGDELLAVNALRLTPKNKDRRLSELDLKRKAVFLLSRWGSIRKLSVKPRSRPPDRYRLRAFKKPARHQADNYRNWLGADPKDGTDG